MSGSGRRWIVAVGASAGGFYAVRQLLAALPADFPAPILIVQHLDPRHNSLMAELLAKRTPLRVKQAEDGEIPEPATVYIAAPDAHLRLDAGGALQFTRTARVHYVRPSVDVLFESVAARAGSRAVAVILTGAGRDGGDGIRAVKEAGGTTVVQEPETAAHPGMPRTAIGTGVVDYVLPLADIAPKLIELVAQGAKT